MNENSKNLFSINLVKKAAEIRLLILDMIFNGKKGHIGGAFSSVEILTSVYYSKLFDINTSITSDSNKDKFLLSKGHCAVVLYSILYDLGVINNEQFVSYGKDGTILGSHPDINISGVEFTSGSLGMGLGVGAGMAFANKLDSVDGKIIVLTGDGETYEGAVWEAALFANAQKLDNLIWIIDRNHQCVLDYTEDINPLEPYLDKIEAFGFNTYEIDGHDFNSILNTFKTCNSVSNGKPHAIIAKTVKGKGVSFMERNIEWHHKVPSLSEYEEAKKQIGQR